MEPRVSSQLRARASLAAGLVGALILGSLGVPDAAHANGAFPASGQVLLHPTDPDALWVRTNFGVVATVDGARSWRLICEEAMGYEAPVHPTMAITLEGSLFMGLPSGVNVSTADLCAFSPATGIDGFSIEDVTQHATGRSLAVGTPAQGPARVFSSTDGALTFAALVAPLPDKFQPLTIDAAPSNEDRIYLSGLTGNPASPVGVLVRTADAGQTWSEVLIPESQLPTAPFIAAVDPADELRVYVRLHGAPGRLLVTEDGGDTWSEIFEGRGFLRAFAVSPDGTVAFVGGEADGVHRAEVPGFDFEKVSTTAVRCLRATEVELFACGTPQDGFAAAVSVDEGVTFETLLDQRCIQGPLACNAGTSVGDACPAAWPAIAEQLGVVDCSGGGGGGAPPSSSSGGAADSSGGAGGNAQTSSSSATGDVTVRGGCRASPSDATPCGPAVALMATVLMALRRIVRDTRRRPPARHRRSTSRCRRGR